MSQAQQVQLTAEQITAQVAELNAQASALAEQLPEASMVVEQASGLVEQATQVVQGVDVAILTEAANGGIKDAIANMINQVTSGAEATAGFLVAAVPDVLFQLVLWYGLRSGVMCLLGLAGLYMIYKTVKNNIGVGEAYEQDGGTRYKLTLTHCNKGNLSPHCMALLFLFIPVFGLIELLSLEWLQILVAPKIWLIEYGANLVQTVAK